MQTEQDHTTLAHTDMGAVAPPVDKGPAWAPGMLRVSPSKINAWVQCQALCAFTYTTDSRRTVPYMAAATHRGRTIHAAVDGLLTAGEAPESTHVPLEPDDETTPADAGKKIAAFLGEAWPGYTWTSERDAQREIVPGVWLVGRLDYVGVPPADRPDLPWVIVDLKTRQQVSHRLQIVSQSPIFDPQTLAYDFLAEGWAPKRGAPQLWQVLYQPKSGRLWRREYPSAPLARARLLDLAVACARGVAAMRDTHPSTWGRSFQCLKPYPCPHVNDCARSLGAFYPRTRPDGSTAEDTNIPAFEGEDGPAPKPVAAGAVAALTAAFGKGRPSAKGTGAPGTGKRPSKAQAQPKAAPAGPSKDGG